MKIRKLFFSNINSLKGEHQVDFTAAPLQNSGLIAITGNTGSGKTTLLDVISIALFNNIPRLERGKTSISKDFIEKTGAILTRNASSAYAAIEYECQEGTFTSKWSISISKRTKRLQDYHMEIADSDGQILDLKKGEVPAKNTALIGLDFEQFTRSMVLAQGDFSKFLKSKKEERGALLEKITGTGIYRTLGKMAFEKVSEINKQINELKIRRNEQEQGLLDDQTLASYKAKNKSELEKITALEKEILAVNAEIQLFEDIDRLSSAFTSAQKQLEEQKRTLKDFNLTDGQKLQKHIALAPLENDIAQFKQNVKEEEQIQLVLHKVREEHQLASEESKKSEQTLRALLPHHPLDIALEKAIEDLENQVEKLELDREKVSQEYVIQQNHFNVQVSAANLSFPVAITPSDLEMLLEKDKEFAKKIELGHQTLVIKESYDAHRAQLIRDQKDIAELNLFIENLKRSTREVQGIEEELVQLERKIKLNLQEVKTLSLSHENAVLRTKDLEKTQEINRLKAKYAEDRKHLKDNTPCPLCGSLSHPAVQNDLESIDSLTEAIASQKQEENLLFERLNKLEAANHVELKQKQALQDKLHLLNQQLSGFQQKVNIVEEKLFLSNTNYSVAAIADKNQSDLESIVILENLKRQKEGIAMLIPLLSNLLEVIANGKAVRKEKDSLFPYKDKILSITGPIKKNWQRAKTLMQSSASQLREHQLTMEKIQSALHEQQERLAQKVKPMGYATIKEAMAKFLDAQTATSLQSKLDQLEQKRASLQAECVTVQNQLNEKTARTKSKSLADLQSQLLGIQNEVTTYKKEYQASRDRIQIQTRKTEAIASLSQQLEKIESENLQWVLLNTYIGDSQGKKFSTFAQQLTLTQLIALANRQLHKLTERYALDIPNDTTEEDNLIIIDQDMGGMRRSVKTLSGGESFLISLSLALGLSDLASKNVKIESLFIDEGFGTLDPATLDQTLDTLERLQAESNKTIGIISHVEALKERVTTQIEVIRNGQGFSHLVLHQ